MLFKSETLDFYKRLFVGVRNIYESNILFFKEGFAMLARPKVKNLSAEEQAAIARASQAQTGGAASGVQKSFDPENFPVFDIPVNQKVLIYVPNHVTVDSEGVTSMIVDKFAAHPVRDGRTFLDIRCTSGVVAESLGLHGECPLCECNQEIWSLFNFERDDIARTKGIIKDDKNPEAFREAMKDDTKKLMDDRAVKPAEVWITFPIVVIDCEEKDGVKTTTPKKNAEGKISGKVYWYQIREKTYIDKWLKGLESAVDAEGNELTHPAGQWIILNYTFRDADKVSARDAKMQSAKNLAVSVRPMGDSYNAWATYFDSLTEEWTPKKAQDTCLLNAVRDKAEMTDVTNTVMRPVRDKITNYQITAHAAAGIAGGTPMGIASAEDVLSNFDQSVGVEADS